MHLARSNVIVQLEYNSILLGLSRLEFRNLSWRLAHGLPDVDVRIATKVHLSHGFIIISYILVPSYCSITVQVVLRCLVLPRARVHWNCSLGLHGMLENPESSGTERNGTEPEVIDAHGRGRRISLYDGKLVIICQLINVRRAHLASSTSHEDGTSTQQTV